jgi:hypothetical protein
MMGRQTGDQSQLFYLFNLEALIPRAICCDGSIRSCHGCRAAREPDAVLQRYRATFDRSGAHAADAHCGLLLRYENALARLHHACDPAPRALRR